MYSNTLLLNIFTRLLLHKLLVDHLKDLTPDQFVFTMFLVGICREYPKLDYVDSRTQGFPLPEALNQKLGRIYKRFYMSTM